MNLKEIKEYINKDTLTILYNKETGMYKNAPDHFDFCESLKELDSELYNRFMNKPINQTYLKLRWEINKL